MMYSMKTVAALMMIMSGSTSAFTFMPTGQPTNAGISQSRRQSLCLSPMILTAPSSPSTLFASTTTSSSSTEEDSTTTSSSNIDLLDEVDSIFDSIDTNGDGEITLEELRSHLVDEMGYTQEYTEYLFASIDTDSSGTISKEEMNYAFYNFEALSMYMTFGMGGAEITKRKAYKDLALKSASSDVDGARDRLLLDDLADMIFDIIDTDSSGVISKDELYSHFESVNSKLAAAKGEVRSSATDTQAQEYVQTMFATLDANEDGGICREEIRTAFEKYDFKLLARTFGLRVYRTAEV